MRSLQASIIRNCILAKETQIIKLRDEIDELQAQLAQLEPQPHLVLKAGEERG